MKAILAHGPGSPAALKVEEAERPVVSDDGVLVRVLASSANLVDLYALTPVAHLQRSLKPGGVGTDFAGTVESVGKAVTLFQPGDEVFGGGRGAFAEYVCIPERKAVVRKPGGVSFEQAATVAVAGTTALQALRDHGRIEPGQRVLINGASGGVGTFAVQLAKSFGAQVTAVCSTRNLDMARSIGADHVIDYTQVNFSRNGRRYDLIVAVNGNHPIRDYVRALSPGGIYVPLGGSLAQFFQGVLLGPVVSRFGRKKVRSFIAKINQTDLVFLKELLEAGKVVPVGTAPLGSG